MQFNMHIVENIFSTDADKALLSESVLSENFALLTKYERIYVFFIRVMAMR